MLEQIDMDKKDLTKEEYKEAYKELIAKLVVVQQEARSEGVGLVVLFEGMVGSGRGDYISDLMYNLDARATTVKETQPLLLDEWEFYRSLGGGMTSQYPIVTPFWKQLGERDTITFFDGGWYSRMVEAASFTLFGDVPSKQGKKFKGKTSDLSKIGMGQMLLSTGLASVAEYERELTNDGYVVVKFFNFANYKTIVNRIAAVKENPAFSWATHRGVDIKTPSKKGYKAACEFFNILLENSNYDFAPWVLLNKKNKRESNMIVAQTIVDALESGIAAKRAAKENPTPKPAPEDLPKFAPKASRYEIAANYPQVETMRYDLFYTREEYKEKLKPLQARLAELEAEAFARGIPTIITYEGWDAAGKGGNIKRIAQALDARCYTIFPSPAPTKTELAHPHLWRYWTRLPEAGKIGLYDRTWYGRVLVERIEGFATPERWAQAYDEINAFERSLVDWGAVLCKFWVDISPEEQLARFEARQADPSKQWKITEEDWRNREKYPAYKDAINDMFRLTSTTYAPWVVLESENKYYARIKALETVIAAMEFRMQ